MTTEDDIRRRREELKEDASARQRRAADPAYSIWVSASAGTGKTKVLTDRVLRLLLAGIAAGKLLCLTYTKAAAVEMNSRVSEKLSQWAVADDDKLEKELKKLFGSLPTDFEEVEKLKTRARKLFALMLDTPGGIKIQTIHSFCQEVLRRFPLEAGISPHFEVMDSRSEREAMEEIKARLIDEAHDNPETPAAKALNFLASRINKDKFPDVMDDIINNRGKITRLFEEGKTPNALMTEQAKKLKVSPDDSEQNCICDFFAQLPVADLKILLAAWNNSGSRFDKRAEKLAQVLEKPEEENIELYVGAFFDGNGDEYTTVAAKKILTDNPELEDIFTQEKQRLVALMEQIKALRVFQATRAVDILTDELIKKYDFYKRSHALMDYGDMIFLTRRLLADPDAARWVLYKLDGGIDSILIDEAQDTSPDQWEIIRALSEDFFDDAEKRRTVFAVGDRKQSIYSFQGADPDKFDDMRRYFSSRTKNFREVDMQVSFRSTAAVLDAVNHLFAVPAVADGVTSEGENVVHIPSRQGECGIVELWPLLEPEKGENVDEWQPPVEHETAPTTSLRMARQIARKIKSMVAGKEMLVSQNRPLRYSDFLVLVRSRDAFCEEFIRECKKAGVQVAGIDRIHLLDQIAVKDLLSLGKFLLLPEDDLSLAEVLKSPLFGLDDDDLIKLCPERKTSLWHVLEQCSDYAETAKILKHLLNMADYVRPFELYSEVLNVFGGRRLFAERMGGEAEDGLNEFLILALSFEQNHTASLQNFIEWFEQDDVEIKREAEAGGADLVRLMTVHGSKGLQAPIVILPDTTRVPQCKRQAEILWDNDDLFFFPTAAADFETTCNRLNESKKEKSLEEYRRLLYVALTRAEDRLIVCGYKKSREPSADCWYNLFAPNFAEIADKGEEKNFLRYVCPQLLPFEKEEKTKKTETPFTAAGWMFAKAPDETPFSRPLTPSKPDEEEPPVISPLCLQKNNRLYKRGTLIHRLLQFLPQTEAKCREEIAARYLAANAAEMPDADRNEIVREVMALLQDKRFGSVFGPHSQAEVPVMGRVGDKIISGQIDRLIVEDNRVVIVDFKTNRPAAAAPEQIPDVYRRQLAAYVELLGQIYPDKEIVPLILWTNTATLMPVNRT